MIGATVLLLTLTAHEWVISDESVDQGVQESFDSSDTSDPVRPPLTAIDEPKCIRQKNIHA